MAFVSSFTPRLSNHQSTRLSPLTCHTTRLPCATARVRMSAATEYDQLSSMTTIVEDTGDIEAIASHRPHSATTNPSLVASAALDPRYSSLVSEAISYGRSRSTSRSSQLSLTRDKLFTLFGAAIVPHLASDGDVSTEVDARLSFDADAQIDTAHRLIALYKEAGVDKSRVLIKLASTWEGLIACKVLEAEGIKTNMTLLFGNAQAIMAAQNGAFLISPFVGRILDWHKAQGNEFDEDPGVVSVRNIYRMYKCAGVSTVVMGASFRNKGEIMDLAGCDRLTIAPKFIADMKENSDVVERKLIVPDVQSCEKDGLNVLQVMDEAQFRWNMNQDAMATEKLAHGIRGFAADLDKLDAQLQALIDA